MGNPFNSGMRFNVALNLLNVSGALTNGTYMFIDGKPSRQWAHVTKHVFSPPDDA